MLIKLNSKAFINGYSKSLKFKSQKRELSDTSNVSVFNHLLPQYIHKNNLNPNEISNSPYSLLSDSETDQGKAASEDILKIFDVLNQENLEAGFVFDLEEVAARLHVAWKARVNDETLKHLKVHYSELPFLVRESYRKIAHVTVEYLNTQGLYVRLVNKLWQIRECREVKIKELKAEFEKCNFAEDELKIKSLDSELAKLEMEKSRDITATHMDNPSGQYHGLPQFGTEGAKKEIPCHNESGVDHYGYKDGESFEEHHGYSDIKVTSHTPEAIADTRSNLSTVEVKSLTYLAPLKRYVPIVEGVMKAKDSTTAFLHLVHDLHDKLKDSIVFQIGSNHGAITTALAKVSKKVVAVDILPEAIFNTALTLNQEEPEVRKKVSLYLKDLSFLKEYVKETETKCKFLFFNCPVFKGEGNPNSLAGNNFELVKRALKLLPTVLDKNGKAFFLATYPSTDEGNERLWTVNKLREFLNKELPGWTFEESQSYIPGCNSHGNYVVVCIQPPQESVNRFDLLLRNPESFEFDPRFYKHTKTQHSQKKKHSKTYSTSYNLSI